MGRGSFSSNPLSVAQGGTGSVIKNFVDLTTNQSVSGNKTFLGSITVPTPVNSTDPVTKSYVDAAVAAGFTFKTSVAATTAVALPANTYANGTLGVGATLTANANGVLAVDGYTPVLNDRILVKNEVAAANNGIYTLTTLGTVSVHYVLTRATDMDQSAEIPGAAAYTNNGTLNSGSGWVVVAAGTITVGTTAINWTQFSTPGLIAVGNGLTKVGTIVSLTSPVSTSDLPIGTISGTVASGDDSRILDAASLIDTDGAVIAKAVIVKGTVLTDIDGDFIFDYSAAGLTHAHSAQVTVVNSPSDISLVTIANIATFSEVKVIGSVLLFGNPGLGLVLNPVADNITVYVTVIGDKA